MAENLTEYVLSARKGDEEAFAKLYSRTLKNAFYLAVKLTNSKDESYEIVKTAYARAFSTIDKLKKPESFDAWIRQTVATVYKEGRTFSFPDANGAASLLNSEFLPESVMSDSSLCSKLEKCVALLPEEQRTAVVLHYNNGMPTAFLAKFFRVSESTASAVLIQARARLIQAIGFPAGDLATSPLPVLTRIFQKSASELEIENEKVREIFIFALEAVNKNVDNEEVTDNSTDEEAAVETVATVAVDATETAVEEESANETDEEIIEDAATEVEEEVAEESAAEAEEEAAEEPATEVEEESEEESAAEAEEEPAEEPAVEAEEEPAEEPATGVEEEVSAVEADDPVAAIMSDIPAFNKDVDTCNDDGYTGIDTLIKGYDEEIANANTDILPDFGLSGIPAAPKADEPAPETEEPAEKPDENNSAPENKDKSSGKRIAVVIIAALLVVAAVAAIVFFTKDDSGDNKTTTSASDTQKPAIPVEWRAGGFEDCEEIFSFNENLCVFKSAQTGKFGLMDYNGNVVVAANYAEFSRCSNGKAYSGSDTYHYIVRIEDGGEWYEISMTDYAISTEPHALHAVESQTLESENYDERDRYFEGFAAARKDGKWGYVAEGTDEVVIDFIYDSANALTPDQASAADYCRPVNGGYVPVMKDGKMGVVDLENNTVADFEYDSILNGDNGVYIACKDGVWGYLLLNNAEVKVIEVTTTTTTEPTTASVLDGASEVNLWYEVDLSSSKVKIRSGPGGSYEQLGELSFGDKVFVTHSKASATGKNWVCFEYEGGYGWVPFAYVRRVY